MRILRWRQAIGYSVVGVVLVVSGLLGQAKGDAVEFTLTAHESPASSPSDWSPETVYDDALQPVDFCTGCGDSFRSDWSLFAGLTGAKQPQDFGVNAHFGARTAVNYGRVVNNSGLGIQIGTAIVAMDHAVQVTERVEGAGEKFQSFTTVGLFQHTGCWHWGAGYDFLWQNDYDEFFLGQWRGQIGYDVTPYTQVGLRTQLVGDGDTGAYGAVGVYLRPINQVTGYLTHEWEGGATVGGWFGMADGHSEANVALGDLPRNKPNFVFGSMVRAPLNSYVSLFGEANFIMPADTGTVDAYLGFEFYPRGGARTGRTSRPVLPVASNATMSIDLFRR